MKEMKCKKTGKRSVFIKFLGIMVLVFLMMSVAAAAPYAYITNSGDNTVSVIDTATDKVTATITVGNSPEGAAITPNGEKVYVANFYGNSISIIDTATNTVTATVSVGKNPKGVAVTPDGKKVYVANYLSNNVSVIDTATNTVTDNVNYDVESRPSGVTVTPDGKSAYITNSGSNDFGDNFVSVIDASNNYLINMVSVRNHPCGVAATPDGKRVYVANSGESVVSVIDTVTNQVTDIGPVASGPYGIVVTPDGAKVYAAGINTNTVSVISTSTNEVIATIVVGDNPAGIAVTPDGKKAYVANSGSNSISVIDTVTDKVVSTVPVGSRPSALGQFIGTPPVKPIFVNVKLINPNEIMPYEESVIKAGVTDISGNPLLGAYVEIIGQYGPRPYSSGYTGADGILSGVFKGSYCSSYQKLPLRTCPDPQISYTDCAVSAKATYNGAEAYSLDYNIKVFNILYTASCSIDSSELVSGEKYTINIHCTDQKNNPVEGIWYFSYLMGKELSNTTNSQGDATITFTAPEVESTTDSLLIVGDLRTSENPEDVVYKTPVRILPKTEKPTANFSSNVTSGYAPLSVQFTDLSKNATSWNWDFGDGITSTEQNPTHTYSKNGEYTVNLTVSNANGTSSKTSIIECLPVVGVSLSTDPQPPFIPGETISVTAEVYPALPGAYIELQSELDGWFAEGYTDTSGKFTGVYTIPDNALERVQYTSNPGGFYLSALANGIQSMDYYCRVSGQAVVSVSLSSDPQPPFTPGETIFVTAEVYPALPGAYIELQSELDGWFANGYTDASGKFIGVYTVPDDALERVQYTSNPGGFYLSALANGIQSMDYYCRISEQPILPVADFTSNVTNGFAPLSVQFTDLSINAASWHWDFGDGTTSTQQNPVHTYYNFGENTVNLTVSNANGTSSKTSIIECLSVVSVSLSSDPQPPFIPGETISVTAEIYPALPGAYVELQSELDGWFAEGYTDTSGKFTGVYTIPDNALERVQYTSNPGGFYLSALANGIQSMDYYCRVSGQAVLPVADFSASPIKGKVPLTVTFADKSTGSPTSWSWNFGDKSTSTDQNPVHEYKKTGKYTVSLTVKNALGSNTKKITNYIVVTK